ncbi:MAG: flagellin [Chromatiales bacterium]|jgi:flagellin|nr:flagellin [Chromatiales bacterium]
MPQIINTNIASLNAQRNLSRTQSDLSQSLQRLSSGLRINSAKDDAAGLAISERMTTQVRGINQAVRNANDGVSLAQTAEGALAELTNNLQRIRELAVQSANSTNSASDRAALDLEVQQRLAEIDRIATQTSFNGLKVLDGTFGSASFQIGANVGETIKVTLDSSMSMRTNAIGALATAGSTVDATSVIVEPVDAVPSSSNPFGAFTSGVSGAAGETFTLTVDGQTAISYTSTGTETVDAATLQAELNSNLQSLATAGIAVSGNIASGTLTFSKADGTSFDIEVDSTLATPTSFAGYANSATPYTINNGKQAVVGVPMTINAGEFTLQVGSGAKVSVTGTFKSADELVAAINAQAGGVVASMSETGGILSITSGEKFTVGGTQAAALGMSGSFAPTGNLLGANVATVDGANDAIQRVDSALTSVNGLRSTFGAIQNRFESTIANLSAAAENLSAARSRIMDADFAQETAALTRAQILQQAGVAILSQANSLPQLALKLLG